MAETPRRNTTNSSSKNRKSRNKIIRSALGIYLKQKNYSASDKYRKSDLALTQSNKQLKYGLLLDDDISKANSFLFSNVLCLSHNSRTVEEQFQKFHQFIESQSNATVQNELQSVERPLLCHLFIELLKGKESHPATDFLKKFAHIIGHIDNLECPVANKINGSAIIISDGAASASPSSSTQITFAREQKTDETIPGYFRNLVQQLSTCLRIEELDSIDITRAFRYSKYEMELSLQSLYALKHFLIKNGHVIILHILQTWFTFEIVDADGPDDDDEEECDAIEYKVKIKTEIERCKSDPTSEMQDLFSRLKAEGKIENDQNSERVCIKQEPMITENTETSDLMKRNSTKLQNIRKSVIKMKSHDKPVRIFRVVNADNRLTSGDIDPSECHLSCGFSDSTVRLWQLNQSTIGGRKPFASRTNRICEWSLIDCYSDESSDDDDDDEDLKKRKKFQEKLDKINGAQSKEERDEEFWKQRSSENTFSDLGGICLRGHSRGITDVVFSKHHPLLFSVSKDLTMRAWKSSNYTCGAVYRGHTYPIWCVAESSLGTYLATGSRDHTARLWEISREHPLQTYIAHTQDVDAIAFHPNGTYIATGSTDMTVRLWCVTSGKLFRVFTDCHLPVQCVSFSPNGKLLAAAGEESKIRIFDLAAGSQLMELKDHTAPVTSLAWNFNGAKLSSCCADGSIRVFNLLQNDSESSQAELSAAAAAAACEPSTSTSSSTNKLSVSYFSDCKRSVKIFFNSNETVSCIGGI